MAIVGLTKPEGGTGKGQKAPESTGKHQNRPKNSTNDTKSAPNHLSSGAKAWWNEIDDLYRLETHHLTLLTLACESYDRGQQARRYLRKHGLTFQDRFDQPKVRPEVGIERDSRVAFARLVESLGLDLEAAPAKTGRPSGIGRR